MNPDQKFFVSVAIMFVATILIVLAAVWFENSTNEFEHKCEDAGGKVVVVDYGVRPKGDDISGKIEECVKGGRIISDTITMNLAPELE